MNTIASKGNRFDENNVHKVLCVMGFLNVNCDTKLFVYFKWHIFSFKKNIQNTYQTMFSLIFKIKLSIIYNFISIHR